MKIFHKLGDSSLRLALWDGASCGAPATSARTTVTINDSPTLFKLVWSPAMAFGDGYSEGQIRVSGDLKYLLEVAYRLPDSRPPWSSLGLVNSLKRSWENVHHHYDLGNDFYQSWLDEELVYTCAYFEDEAERGAAMTLEAAQRAKLDLVCRKLPLEPGQHVVEAGCGWGALASHGAALRLTVRAFNISANRSGCASRRRCGRRSPVEFISRTTAIDGHCDRFVSVGMLEHVGVKHFGELGTSSIVLDRQHGRCCTSSAAAVELSRWIDADFPGRIAVAGGNTIGVLEPHRFSVLDVENLRMHTRGRSSAGRRYAVMPRVVSQYGERFARWQRISGSTLGFTSGTCSCLVVFGRTDNTVPLTRTALYRRDAHHGTC